MTWSAILNRVISVTSIKTVIKQTGLSYYKVSQLRKGEMVDAAPDVWERLKALHDGLTNAGMLK